MGMLQTLKNIGAIFLAFNPKSLNDAEIAGVQKLIDGVNVAENTLKNAQDHLEALELQIQHAENAVYGAKEKLNAKLKELENAYPAEGVKDSELEKDAAFPADGSAVISELTQEAPSNDADAVHSDASVSHCDASHTDCSVSH